MSTTSVTILMPAYNAAAYIAEAITSVLQQTFTAFELLIVNDGSTDHTLDIIRSFNDPRIRVIHQANSGVATALNTGLQHATGTYIARFDADDVCMPQRLEKQVAFLDTHPEYVITGSDAEYISATGDYLCSYACSAHEDADLKRQLHTHCPFTHSSVLFRKAAVLQCGGYDARAHNMEDHLLWVQLSSSGRFYNIPEALIKVRFNPGSVTIDEKWRGKRFRIVKYGILERGRITEREGRELRAIITSQDTGKIKQGAYYALCGKKYLVNNYQPAKSRLHTRKAIALHPLRLDNYALLAAAYLPSGLIRWLHRQTH